MKVYKILRNENVLNLIVWQVVCKGSRLWENEYGGCDCETGQYPLGKSTVDKLIKDGIIKKIKPPKYPMEYYQKQARITLLKEEIKVIKSKFKNNGKASG